MMERQLGRTILRALKNAPLTGNIPGRRMGMAPLTTSSSKAAVPRKAQGGSSQAPATTTGSSGSSIITPSSLLRGSPLWQRSPFSRFFEDFEREFADPFFSPVTRPLTSNLPDLATATSMSLDITETDKQYVIKAELPGVKKEDVKVSFKDHVLSIVAERKEEKSGEDETKHYTDFVYGKITRHLRVPETVDKDSIEASMEDGVLAVKLNKSEQAQQEATIEIK